MKTIADFLIDKGRQEGIQMASARIGCVMLLEGFDIEITARVANLKIERVLELKTLVESYGADVLKIPNLTFILDFGKKRTSKL